MAKKKMGIDAHIYIYHCDCEECPTSGDSVTEKKMVQTMNDLLDWLGDRGLVYSGSYKLVDMNED